MCCFQFPYYKVNQIEIAIGTLHVKTVMKANRPQVNVECYLGKCLITKPKVLLGRSWAL